MLSDHFADVGKMIELEKGAQRESEGFRQTGKNGKRWIEHQRNDPADEDQGRYVYEFVGCWVIGCWLLDWVLTREFFSAKANAAIGFVGLGNQR